MSKRKDGQAGGRYTLEFKLEAVRLVKGGQAVPVTAKILGVPTQTLERDILKKPRRTSRGNRCEVRVDCRTQNPVACHTGLRVAGGQRQWLEDLSVRFSEKSCRTRSRQVEQRL